jgi:hypothetical protein
MIKKKRESSFGESGFGCVLKGWIEKNRTALGKPGTGLNVDVKTLNPMIFKVIKSGCYGNFLIYSLHI